MLCLLVQLSHCKQMFFLSLFCARFFHIFHGFVLFGGDFAVLIVPKHSFVFLGQDSRDAPYGEDACCAR